jgi:hypothetical protein
MAGARRRASPIGPLPGSDLIELPVTTVELGGRRMAAGGGGFFRLLPYRFSSWAIGRVNTDDERPAVFYFHPGRSIPASRGWRGRRSNRGFAITAGYRRCAPSC